jgi:23S rRNA (cytidine1920-2'-O)/16S rRNA (cytidine1409-2'-O)-methyltransferase
MKAASKKQRADLLLVELGLAESRSKAQAMIMAGEVFADERRVEKAGERLRRDAVLRVKERPPYVSRGGQKLAHALSSFADAGLDPSGKICVDVGASTGGFSDCLLQHQAEKVYAVDVGWGQLHQRLRSDARIVVRERTNARHMRREDFDEPIALVVVDASFIGIGKLIDAIAQLLGNGGELVALIKPQFEAGKEVASRAKGVISDDAERQAAIASALADIEAAGFEIIANTDSPIRGPKGNLEHLTYCRKRSA